MRSWPSAAAYLLALKANQTKLYEQVAHIFSEAGTGFFSLVKHTVHETVEEGHGRRELRRVWTTTDLSRVEETSKWPGLRSITMIERERQVGPDGEIASERHYFISSRARTSAKTMASLIRDHWSIENQCHRRAGTAGRARLSADCDLLGCPTSSATSCGSLPPRRRGARSPAEEAPWDTRRSGRLGLT
ncbi:ISAs1 family transposase [Sorangium sp. So ce1128]